MEFFNITFINKVNLASLNGDEGTSGNITSIKKVTANNGDEFVYVSGQAQRRYLKETLQQLGEKLSGVDKAGNPTIVIDEKEEELNKKSLSDKLFQAMFKQVCDLDLFGYMLPKDSMRRWSVVKVSPLLSIFPYKGEFDYLTRKHNEKGGSIVQVEIDSLNFMRGNYMIDSHKIGKNINEYNYQVTDMLSADEIKQRRSVLIDAIKYLNGGGKQSRNMEDLSPKFVVAINQKVGTPFLLNSINMKNDNSLIIEPIIEVLENNRAVINSVAIGLASGIFSNEAEIREKFKNIAVVVSVNQALDSLKI